MTAPELNPKFTVFQASWQESSANPPLFHISVDISFLSFVTKFSSTLPFPLFLP
jgi:hypothetical protein